MRQTYEVVSPTDEDLCELVSLRGRSADDYRRAREACGELYTRHARGLLAFLATRAGRSDLDDVHQAVWQKVWISLENGFSGGNFRAWLFQITRNYLIDESRKKRPDQMADEYDERDDQARRPDEILLDRERMETLARCLEKLAADARALVQARLRGEDYDAICQRLNLEAARAHRLFHTAKQQLQSCVGQE